MYRNRNNKLEMSVNEIEVISRRKGKNKTTTKKQEKVDSPLILGLLAHKPACLKTHSMTY